MRSETVVVADSAGGIFGRWVSMMYGLRISMTSGDDLVCGCMRGLRRSQEKLTGLKSGGQTKIQGLLQSTI